MRLFTALTLPAPVLAELEAARRRLEAVAEFKRWQPIDQAHLTLHFLGEVPEERVDALHGLMREGVPGHAPFSLQLGTLGVFGNEHQPRVLWIGLGGDLSALMALQADLAERIRAAGFPLETRAYRPHLTLAREARQPTSLEALRAAAAIAPLRWEVRDVTLFQSRLAPQGALHTALGSVALGG